MRIIIIFIFCMLSNILGYTQELSVTLSIHWKREKLYLDISPLKPGTELQIPFLKLTYRNFSHRNIYFYKSFSSNHTYLGLAPFFCIMDMCKKFRFNKDHGKQIVTLRDNYKEEEYILDLAGFVYIYNKKVYERRKVEETGHFGPTKINDLLFWFHEALLAQEELTNLGIEKQMPYFGYPNKEIVSYQEADSIITAEKEKRGLKSPFKIGFPETPLKEEDILGEYSNRFIFLKAEETYEEEFNLIGFYLLKGGYEFLIELESLPSYIYGRAVDDLVPEDTNQYLHNNGDIDVASNDNVVDTLDYEDNIEEFEDEEEGIGQGEEVEVLGGTPCHVKYDLPKVVKGYYRYDKKFFKNSVKIKFD